MKLIFLIIFVLNFFSCLAQKSKGFAYIGLTSFLSSEFDDRAGLQVGACFSPEHHVAIGAGFDILAFARAKNFFQAFGDIRVFFSGRSKGASPFIALQPGAVLYKNNSLAGVTRGSFAFNGLIGFMGRPKRGLGLYFDAGYTSISFTSEGQKTEYGGVKVGAGIAF